MSSTSSCPRGQRMPSMRVGENPFNRSVYFIQENRSQPILPFLIVQRRLSQLRQRWRRKSVFRHFLRDERRFSIADGPSTAVSSPRSKASILSSDSVAHLSSISLTRSSSRLSQDFFLNGCKAHRWIFVRLKLAVKSCDLNLSPSLSLLSLHITGRRDPHYSVIVSE